MGCRHARGIDIHAEPVPMVVGRPGYTSKGGDYDVDKYQAEMSPVWSRKDLHGLPTGPDRNVPAACPDQVHNLFGKYPDRQEEIIQGLLIDCSHMCGRFTISLVVGLYERFNVPTHTFEITPRYNIAPSQDVPVVIRTRHDGLENEIQMMTWGLVPSWSKDPSRSPKPINARADTLVQKPMFRNILKNQRCLIPATGFYEWKKERWGKIPFYIRMKDNSLFAFAGLYDRYRDPSGHPVGTFTLITTEPNNVVLPYHDRMPAILRREDEERWLEPTILHRDELDDMLQPYPSTEMLAYPVSKAVNGTDIDNERLIKPILTF
jgi:putative SOS response-associated peptidase YedK